LNIASEFDAVIFDMDGVVTDTASVHAAAWKQTFDTYLRSREREYHQPFKEFTTADYHSFVDGRPRYNGVEAFLKSRGIKIPRGTPEDCPGRGTVCGLGNQKNAVFNRLVESEGVRLFDSTVVLIRELLQCGVRVGLATSSNNSAAILGRTGTASLFATIVDGMESARLGLKGKPAPDIFAAAATNMGVPSARAIIVEDAVAGVQAGAEGGFALVVGVARENNERKLRESGADVVVRDLSETSLEQINRLVQDKRTRAR
jgi:beta-phosphoglucomutase family hydrolase